VIDSLKQEILGMSKAILVKQDIIEKNFIQETIESALRQTHTDIEIIVVNDASTDNTEQKVLVLNDPRIIYYKNNENISQVANWNRAIKYANGEYIKLLCQDDILFPQTIEKELDAFTNSDVVLTISDTELIDDSGKNIGYLKHLRKKGLLDGKIVAKKNALWRNIFGTPGNNLYRKDVFINVGGYDESFRGVSDMDLSARIACTGKVYNFCEVMYAFRVHKQGHTTEAMSEKYSEFIDEHVAMLNKHKKTSLYPISRLDFFRGILMRRIRYQLGKIYMKIVLRSKE